MQHSICQVAIGLVLLLSSPSFGQDEPPTTEEIVQRTIAAIEQIQSLTYILKNSERFDGELISAEIEIKYQRQPKRCYFNMIRPNRGAELFFQEGSNENRAIYNPSGFPFMTLNLDPMGEPLREKNHHTLFEAGFDYIGQVIQNVYAKDKDSFSLLESSMWDNRECYRIVMEFPDFGMIDYQVADGETTRDIAEKHHLNEYKIVELNPEIERFGPIETGNNISIPNCYAQRMELTIDKENYLPIQQKIYDEKGLFEVYEFVDLRLNDTLDESNFEVKRKGK